MSRPFITLIVTSALALATLTAPARADNDDAARALAAILGLAIVGKIIHDNRKDDRHVVTRRAPRDTVHPRPLPRRVDRKLLPQQCFRTFYNARGREIRGFGQRCMNRNYDFVRSLPRACATDVQTRRGWGTAYRARCLRDQGYRLARN
ncbi:MAG: hypothetical protein AAGF60_15010 [Pseudomonadota bacterium]